EKVAVACDGRDAVDEIRRRLGYRERVPSQLIRCGRDLIERGRAEKFVVDLLERFVQNARTNAIRPGSFVMNTRHRERRSGELLRVQSQRSLLRRVSADRQRPVDRLSRELISESG